MVKLIAREKWLKTFCKINSCEASENKAIYSLACEQAHRGALVAGREKEGELATTSLEFEYLH